MFHVTSYILIILQSPITEDMKMFYHKCEMEWYKNIIVKKELLPAS